MKVENKDKDTRKRSGNSACSLSEQVANGERARPTKLGRGKIEGFWGKKLAWSPGEVFLV